MVVCEPVVNWFFWFFFVYSLNAFGNQFAQSVPNTYSRLIRPSFAPPSWLFPIAWTINFILLATSAFLVWLQGDGFDGNTWQLIYFIVHICLLPIWTILFWRFELRAVAFALIILISLVALGNVIMFAFVL